MKNITLKKAIPSVLLGIVSLGGGHGMEVIQPAKACMQTNKIFLGLNKGDFVGFGSTLLFHEFSSERLNYRLPDEQLQKEIINLVSSEEIFKTYYRGGSTLTADRVRSDMEYSFLNNKKFKSLKISGILSTYTLSSKLFWGVTSKIDNQLIGTISYHFIHPWEAEKSAPEGDLYEFYKKDIKKNIYVSIAYAVSPQHQRQGYATEMSLALIGTLFQHSNAEVIVHSSIEGNIGSERSAKTCCFIHKGISHDENFKILRKSSQLRLLEEREPPKEIEPPQTEEGRLLENLVFDLIQQNNIAIKIDEKIDNTKKSSFTNSKLNSFLPKDIEELRTWCAKGYLFGENEIYAKGFCTKNYPKECTQHYSFQLFCDGIINGRLPFVRYVLEYHNNIWSRNSLDDLLVFSFANTSGPSSYSSFTMITYLIKKDFLEIFDYVIKNKEFRDFTFGATIKNGMGNTPFHTLAKYGSEAMIKRFLMETDLVVLCLNADNIKGENGKNPLQIAESLGRSEGILNLLRTAVLGNNSMDIEVNRSI